MIGITMKRILLALFVWLCTAQVALAQLSQIQRSELRDTNLLGPWNSGFENGSSYWTNTGAAFAVTTSTVLDGTTSASWTPSASGQTLDSHTVVVTSGMLGAQCQAQILYKGGSSNITFEVYDVTTSGIVSSASQALSAATTPVNLVLPFVCPATADTIKLRLTSTASSAIVYLDKAFLGLAAYNGIVAVSPVVYSQPKTVVGSVGTSGQIAAGHILTTTEWPFTIAGSLAFYNFSSSTTADNSGALSCSSGTAACTLTATGSPTISATNIFGTTNAALSSNGSTQYLTSTDAFFNGGNSPFSAGGWFNSSNWSTSQGLLGQMNSASDRSWSFQYSSGGLTIYAGATATSWDIQQTITYSLTNNTWHHFAISYNGSAFTAYVDGKAIGTVTPPSGLRADSSPIFSIGQYYAGQESFLGSIEDVFYVKNYAMTQDDIRKTFSYSWAHNKNIPVANQILTGNWYRADSNIANQLTSSWVVNKTANTLYTDFSDIASTAYIDFSMTNNATSATSIPANSYDSGWLSSTPSTTIPHGLGAVPSALQIQYESNTPSAGNYQNLEPGDYCSFDNTNLYCDWTSLTIGSSNQIRIQAWMSGAANAVIAAGSNNSGIVNTTAQTFAGAKTWNDVQTFYASSGALNAGGYTTTGNWTLGNTTQTGYHSILGNASNSNEPVMWVYNTTSNSGNPSAMFSKKLNSSATSNAFIFFEINNSSGTPGAGTGSGQINANGTNAVAFGSYSDRRLKKNIEALPSQLDSVLSLKPVEFDYKSGGHQIGFIAQDIEQIYPDAVSPDANGYLVLTGWDKTSARLVKAIQELNAKVEELKRQCAN